MYTKKISELNCAFTLYINCLIRHDEYIPCIFFLLYTFLSFFCQKSSWNLRSHLMESLLIQSRFVQNCLIQNRSMYIRIINSLMVQGTIYNCYWNHLIRLNTKKWTKAPRFCQPSKCLPALSKSHKSERAAKILWLVSDKVRHILLLILDRSLL